MTSLRAGIMLFVVLYNTQIYNHIVYDTNGDGSAFLLAVVTGATGASLWLWHRFIHGRELPSHLQPAHFASQAHLAVVALAHVRLYVVGTLGLPLWIFQTAACMLAVAVVVVTNTIRRRR